MNLQLSFLLFAWSIVGCSSLPNGRGWGQDATLRPGWDRICRAAWNSAASAAAWGPAAGAIAFQVGSADRNLAMWAMKNTPVYGSKDNAVHASDSLLSIISAAYVGSALAAPSGDQLGTWALAKAKGFAVGYSAVAINSQATGLIKDETTRTRPDGSDRQSFPSNHATKAGVFAALASRNLETIPLSKETLVASQIGLDTLTASVAWARLEAGRHYPSDVLAGVAIGHFIGAFINDAFIGHNGSYVFVPVIEASREGILIGITFNY
jgi:membrane-associated phospholipid phosphatase